MKIKLYLILFFTILIVFQARNLITNIQISDIYYVNLDPIFSYELSSNIKEFINENLKNKKAEEFIKNLKDKFPLIKSVIIQRTNPYLLIVKIKGLIPLYKINDELIFTEKKELFSKSLFTNNSISNLKTIFIKENITPSFLNFLDKIPKYITDQFNIIWQNKNLIYLQDKDDAKLTILIIHNEIPNEKIIRECKKIKMENQFNNKKHFIADLRFSNQLIISQN